MNKNYARPSAEQEMAALAWATEYFVRFKADLEKGIPDELYKQSVDAAVAIYDYSRDNKNRFLDAADATVDGIKVGPTKVAGFAVTDSAVDDYLRRVSATLVERDKQLPAPLAGFVAASLRDPSQPAPRPKGNRFI
jgi:hypothetical protein